MDQTNAPAAWAWPRKPSVLSPGPPIFEARALFFLLIKEPLNRGGVPGLQEEGQMSSE